MGLPVCGLLYVVLAVGQYVQEQVLLHRGEHALQVPTHRLFTNQGPSTPIPALSLDKLRRCVLRRLKVPKCEILMSWISMIFLS